MGGTINAMLGTMNTFQAAALDQAIWKTLNWYIAVLSAWDRDRQPQSCRPVGLGSGSPAAELTIPKRPAHARLSLSAVGLAPERAVVKKSDTSRLFLVP
jgi:hypothetical protein